jgi:single-strand DNA-binding protein
MYDLNKVMIIGRLTKDPEVRTTPNGSKVVSFSVAMTMSKNKDTGDTKTEYIDCVAWEGLAEIIEKYVIKGTQVYVEGQIQTRSWEGTDGKKNYKTEVLVKEMKILTPKSSGENQSYGASNSSLSFSQSSQTTTKSKTDTENDMSSELPQIDLDEITTPF